MVERRRQGQEERSSGHFCDIVALWILSWKLSYLTSCPDVTLPPSPGWVWVLSLTQFCAHSQGGSKLTVQDSLGKFPKVNGTSQLPAHQPVSGWVC